MATETGAQRGRREQLMRRWVFVLSGCLLVFGCEPRAGAQSHGRAPGKRAAMDLPPLEPVYEGGLAPTWTDYGWAPRKLGNGPASLDMSQYAGWIIARPGLAGAFAAVVFRFKAPESYGDFFELKLDSSLSGSLPRRAVNQEHRRDLPDGWSEVLVSMAELNPRGLPFDRIVIRALRAIEKTPVLIDHIGLVPLTPGTAMLATRPMPTGPAVAATMSVDCGVPAKRISPLVYGIAFDARLDLGETHQWQLGATARRWGGNTASRYNWELGNAWNTASDWFFRNVNYSPRADFSYTQFLDDNLTHGVQTALTVPLLGWVARDRESASFPVSVFGPQRQTDPTTPDAGDGYTADGKPIPPGPQTRTSIASTPDFVGRWVAAIRERDRQRGVRSVHEYILDNEPMLWNSTHRDVHPDPVGYDELLAKTLGVAAAVRKADPEAIIAGPALWGWPAYGFSAIDAVAGFRLKPDRRAHGDMPLLAWYLKQLREHERRTGERLLDVVDVHFYPQGNGMAAGPKGETDPDTSARRIRSTRGLWDPTYVDESWIGEPIRLIPRLREWIDANYPGRKISLGEYSFGAERHPSGGLAQAEALGRFGQFGVDSAYYWTYPAKDSFAFGAFRAFRNYDDAGARFLDWSLSTRASSNTSLFASRDAEGKKLVLVALNLDPDHPALTDLDVSSCGAATRKRTFTMSSDSPLLKEVRSAPDGKPTLPPYSVNVIEFELVTPLKPL